MLVIRIKKGRQKHFKLLKQLKIGRGSNCDIRLKDSKASREHALVYRKDSKVFLRDLGSSNGTFCNDDKIDSDTLLRTGDMILVGSTEMTLEDVVEESELIGRRLGGYRLLEVVGRGGMGVVFKANQLSMDRNVALKVLNRSLVEREDLVERFLKEARAAGVLNHPNLIQVHDVGTEGKNYYFSMEFVEGATVSQVLRRTKAFPESLAVYVVKEVSKALEFAHGRGFVHRDIKPSNIMIDVDGNVKLADLGIAETLRNIQAGHQKGRVMGTPEYMSPEQARGQTVDTRTDLYSLGATLYHMVSGIPPFRDDKTSHLIRKVATEPPPPLARTVPDVSDNLITLVEGMMTRDAENRIPSATEVIHAIDERWHWSVEHDSTRRKRLADFMKGLDAETVSENAAAPLKPVPVKWLIAGGAGVIVLLLSALVMVRSTRQSPPEEPAPAVASQSEDDSRSAMQHAHDELIDYVRSNPEELEIVAFRCNRFLEEFPDNPYKKQIRAIKDEARRQARKKLRMRELEDAYKGAVTFSEENPDNLEGQWRLWRDFLAEYGDSSYAEKAAQNFESVKRRMESRSGETFKAAMEEADKLASNGRYHAAWTRLRPFEEGQYSTEIKQEAKRHISAYRNEYERLYREMKDRYDKAMANKRYGEAVAACKDFAEKAEGGERIKQAHEMANAARKKINDEYAAGTESIRNKLEAYSFLEAETAAELLKDKLEDTGKEKDIDSIIERIRSIRKLHDTAVEAIAAADRPKMMPFALERIGRGRINGATQERLSIDFGEIKQDLLWMTFTKEQILEIYQMYVDERFKENKQLLTTFATEFKVEGKYYKKD